MVGRGELTDWALARIEPLLPVSRRGRRWCDHRQVINAILPGIEPSRSTGKESAAPGAVEQPDPPRRRWTRATDADGVGRRPGRRQSAAYGIARRYPCSPDRPWPCRTGPEAIIADMAYLHPSTRRGPAGPWCAFRQSRMQWPDHPAQNQRLRGRNKQHNVVERYFNRLKQFRGSATRYAKRVAISTPNSPSPPSSSGSDDLQS